MCITHIDRATLRRSAELARRSGTTIHDVLISLGWIEEKDYVQALARHLDVDVLEPKQLVIAPGSVGGRKLPVTAGVAGAPEARAIRATAYTPARLVELMARSSEPPLRVALATSQDMQTAVIAHQQPEMMRQAKLALDRFDADLSARRGSTLWQRILLAILAGLPIGGAMVGLGETIDALALTLSLPFACVVLLRCAALWMLARGAEATSRDGEGLTDAELPTYSILVPLYREAEVLPRLLLALSRLDYPTAKLEILLVLESSDAETRAAAEALSLPGSVRIVIVPPGGPRTKPKALNYALQLARGDFVVVFDAEDRPEPGQLRAAVARFSKSEPGLACVQARLNTYNPDASLLTRQFTIEYSVLFDATLPALERLGLPVPLGGTSNHFPIETLRAIGGWDPYNVTEDADLGIRLARFGLHTATISSTTWEEAPPDFANWWTQRTRWLKGWMQTWLVHMRRPTRLWRDLGATRCIGLHVLMGGMLLSVLVYPVFLAMLAAEFLWGRNLVMPFGGHDSLAWTIAAGNLVLGFSASILAGVLAAARRRRYGLALWALAMPAYWALVSAAGYRAVWQLVRNPFLWEKTQHGRRRR